MNGFRFAGAFVVLGVVLAGSAAMAQTSYGSNPASRDADNDRAKKVMICQAKADAKGLKGADKRNDRAAFVDRCVKESK